MDFSGKSRFVTTLVLAVWLAPFFVGCKKNAELEAESFRGTRGWFRKTHNYLVPRQGNFVHNGKDLTAVDKESGLPTGFLSALHQCWYYAESKRNYDLSKLSDQVALLQEPSILTATKFEIPADEFLSHIGKDPKLKHLNAKVVTAYGSLLGAIAGATGTAVTSAVAFAAASSTVMTPLLSAGALGAGATAASGTIAGLGAAGAGGVLLAAACFGVVAPLCLAAYVGGALMIAGATAGAAAGDHVARALTEPQRRAAIEKALKSIDTEVVGSYDEIKHLKDLILAKQRDLPETRGRYQDLTSCPTPEKFAEELALGHPQSQSNEAGRGNGK